MENYLNSKVVEYSFLLDWLESEIKGLQARNASHPLIIKCLQDKLGELRQLHNKLRIIGCLGNDKLVARAIPIIHDMEYQIIILTYYYIPGLERENADDIFIRDLVSSVKARCGLSWVEDILVRLDSHHAIFPAIPEIPVIFAPPQHTACTLDMAAIYHELGHDVFQRFKEIGDDLAATVYLYFSNLKQSAGTMAPEKRKARDSTIKNALKYWNTERLNEIFSDIYAAYVCGPAYYFSSVDFVIRLGRNPFAITVTDVHPPWAGRVYACHNTLVPSHKSDEAIRWIEKIWNAYTANQQKNADFDMFCPTALVGQLVDISIQNIQRLLPAAQRYSAPLQDFVAKEGDFPAGSLEKVLNDRIKMLHKDPGRCAEWEKKAVEMFKKPTREP